MENTNHGRQIILCQIIDSPIRHAVEIEQVLVVRDGPILPLEGVVRGLVLLNRIQFWPRKKRKKEKKRKEKGKMAGSPESDLRRYQAGP